MLNEPTVPGHNAVVPPMLPGVLGMAGLTDTERVLAALVPQILVAVTVISPFWPVVPEVTDIEVVPAPLLTVQPVGTVQV
jgi:hypothetical protein